MPSFFRIGGNDGIDCPGVDEKLDRLRDLGFRGVSHADFKKQLSPWRFLSFLLNYTTHEGRMPGLEKPPEGT